MGWSIAATGAALVLAGAAVLGGTGAELWPPPASSSTAGAVVERDLWATQRRAPTPPSQPSAYRWPTGGPVPVVRAFDGPEVPWARGHRGVDLALPPDAEVHAAADGVVAFAGTVVDRPVISIAHPDGLRTTYEPVVPLVARGQTVRGGDVIGHLAAATGHCEAASCLHWGARRGPDEYVDPLLLLRPTVIRLFPLE